MDENKDIENESECCQQQGKPAHRYSRWKASKAQCCAACHDGESDMASEDMGKAG